ncbi:MAG: bifunctional serine/threonine-protein kinase/formylglycine-generating enzyme family protein [Planctomycetes bacterium]|nr:bifunctional serine/threonine-protein kinase/formylglycine-generating enzyme family protein [Planctomycetota bacterium]
MVASTPRDPSGNGLHPSRPSSHEPPADLAGHRIVRRLGAGGMGAVFLADAPAGGQVALKVLRPDLGSGAHEFAARFRRECAVMAAVQHPNVVHLLGAGEDRGWCWLAMEYLPDGDLESYLRRRGTVMERDALAMMAKCCRGLAAIHAAGLVHRDVKPANVFLDLHSGGEPVAKVGDLGLARHADGEDRLTHTGTACGTPTFMAPEQIRAQGDIDARADVYALGATLFRLVTGQDPFQGKSIYVVSQSALRDPVPDPRRWNPVLSNALVGIVLKAMAKDRDERFATIEDMRRDLERLHEGRSTTHAGAVPSPASMIFKEVVGESAPRSAGAGGGAGDGGMLGGISWGPVLRLAIPAAAGLAVLWGLSNLVESRTEARQAGGGATSAATAAARPLVDTDEHGTRLRLPVAGRVLQLRWCPPGRFAAGADAGTATERSRNLVLTRGFWMLDREVDQGLWAAVMGQPAPTEPDWPQGDIGRGEAELFCQRLNHLVPKAQARLPTEAEWERACRAGADREVRAGADDRSCRVPELERAWPAAAPAQVPLAVEDAWRWRREDERLRPRFAGRGAPNPWGIRDLLGNQQEWCADDWDGSSPPDGDERPDPRGTVGALAVVRGGSWLHPAGLCRSGARAAADPHGGRPWIGFRLVIPGGDQPVFE